jgi:hypothetical protein
MLTEAQKDAYAKAVFDNDYSGMKALAENKTPQSPQTCGVKAAFEVLRKSLARYSDIVSALNGIEGGYSQIVGMNEKMSAAMTELTAENDRLIEQLNIAVDHIHEMHEFCYNKRGDANMVHIKSGLALTAMRNLEPQSDERTEWKGQPEL